MTLTAKEPHPRGIHAITTQRIRPDLAATAGMTRAASVQLHPRLAHRYPRHADNSGYFGVHTGVRGRGIHALGPPGDRGLELPA